MIRNGLITTWARFEESVRNCFGPSEYEDPNRALLKLGTVKDYEREFEKLMNRATDIPDSLLISFYVSRLKLHLQRELNLVSRPTTLGDVFSLAHIIEARFEDTNNQAVDNNGGDKKDPNVYDKQEVKKTGDQEIENVKDEGRKNVNDQQVSKQTINETANTITSLQSEVASLDAKKVEKLLMELQLKNNFREALETTSKDLDKKMLDLNPKLHDPQKVAVDQKKHYNTKYALKINDEEFKKAKPETTTKIRKLAKPYRGRDVPRLDSDVPESLSAAWVTRGGSSYYPVDNRVVVSSLLYLVSQMDLDLFCRTYNIPADLRPELPGRDDTIQNSPTVKIGIYTRFIEFANFRIPSSRFLLSVLQYYQINFSQLSVLGAAKVSHFEIMCRVLGHQPSLGTSRRFYVNSISNGWLSFSRRCPTPCCFSKKFDSLKSWNDHFFWIDAIICPVFVLWYSDVSVRRDPLPSNNLVDFKLLEKLNNNRTVIRLYPKTFLCLVELSRSFN
ncbi:hypothetical protein Tco_0060699 [Tanacetum coccineum]